MSSHTFQTVVKIPNETLWIFLHSKENWHQVIPGYISHEFISDKVSTWKVKSNFGLIKKKIHFKAQIIDWKEFEKITFRITGISDKFNGHGRIETIKLSNHKTSIAVAFQLTAEGSIAKLIKPFLKSSIPEMSEESKYEFEQLIKKVATNHS
ncbi:CoxG family protein [Niallia sp. Krafla_26]|uniref:CoxG family protein n=1 Tax=Niallia sp. Krafla_26 TaxID=3064703 RepID=UPI003D16CB04